MRRRPHEAGGPGPLGAWLAACILGLVLCPFGYMAIGALRGFNPAFGRLAVPLVLLSAGYLLYAFLARPGAWTWGGLRIAGAVVSGVLIGMFLVVISGYTLLTPFERIGLTATLFLVATALALPFVHLRPTDLRARLERLPRRVTGGLLLAVLGGAMVIVAVYLLRAPAFL